MRKKFINIRPPDDPDHRSGCWRVVFILAIFLILLLMGCGDKKPTVYRVGILSGIDDFFSIAEGFMSEMAQLGYMEGNNIVYDIQKVNADPAAEQRVVKQFVKDGVDLVFTFPTEPAIVAKAATQGTDIPVVFAMAGLEGNNLVESVRQPGGNITGVRFTGPDVTAKRLEFLHELAPHVKRLYITYDVNYPLTAITLEVLRPVALSMGVTIVEAPVTSVTDIEADLKARSRSNDIGMDAILIMPELLSQSPKGWMAISSFAAQQGVPIAGAAGFTADQGAVFSYAPDFVEAGRLAAPLAHKIFEGLPAGTIPVVTPENYLRFNYKLAIELGLTVPESLLLLAKEIIR